jgi:catechol 2,3-dioxygenase-like lactoylglutathione lyase family enzyme
MALTQGTHHIGLTVPNINATRDFFVNVLEFSKSAKCPTIPRTFCRTAPAY